MIKNCVVLCTIVIITACGGKTKKAKNEYFEGFVESSIDIHTGSNASDSLLYMKFGKYVTTYIKDSFIARVYSNENKVIVGREIIRIDSLKFYQVNPSSDTIAVTDLTNDYYFSNLSMKEIEGKKVLGKSCLGVLMVNKIQQHLLSDPFTSNTTYYFDTSFRLSPALNRKVQFGSYNKVFGKYPFLTMAFSQEFEGVTIAMTAKRVVQNEVDKIMFEIPKGKVMVNPFLR